MSLPRHTLWIMAALLAAAPLHAQIVRGRVLDARSGEPVPQASVTALTVEQRNGGRARTAADGTFTLQLRAAGTFMLRGERAGYQPSTTQAIPVAVREMVTVELRVSPQPMQIDPLRVTARVQPPHDRVLEMNGFYDREASGLGRFVRREDMDLHPEFNLAHTLARVPGVELDRDQRGREIVTFTRGRIVGTISRTQVGKRDDCFPLIYLDGTLMRYAPPNDVQLNDIIHPDQVEALEVYRSAAEIPPQYNGVNSACGVILIWTRHEIRTPQR